MLAYPNRYAPIAMPDPPARQAGKRSSAGVAPAAQDPPGSSRSARIVRQSNTQVSRSDADKNTAKINAPLKGKKVKPAVAFTAVQDFKILVQNERENAKVSDHAYYIFVDGHYKYVETPVSSTNESLDPPLTLSSVVPLGDASTAIGE